MKTNLSGVNQNIPKILASSKTIAIVGVSNKPHRTSHSIGLYLIQAGYTIYPVNPNYDTVFGKKCYKSLSEIPDPIDIVNIFRKSETVLPVAEEAIRIGAKTIWMQLGVINEEAAVLALNAGLQVVMDHCIKIAHSASI